jgi:YHS domain-containing protein
MKTKLRPLLITAILGLALAACSSSAPAVTAGVKPYPLKDCLVTGNELGSMGKPISKVYDGQEIRFCCKPCVKKFEANPAKYLAMLK